MIINKLYWIQDCNSNTVMLTQGKFYMARLQAQQLQKQNMMLKRYHEVLKAQNHTRNQQKSRLEQRINALISQRYELQHPKKAEESVHKSHKTHQHSGDGKYVEEREYSINGVGLFGFNGGHGQPDGYGEMQMEEMDRIGKMVRLNQLLAKIESLNIETDRYKQQNTQLTSTLSPNPKTPQNPLNQFSTHSPTTPNPTPTQQTIQKQIQELKKQNTDLQLTLKSKINIQERVGELEVENQGLRGAVTVYGGNGGNGGSSGGGGVMDQMGLERGKKQFVESLRQEYMRQNEKYKIQQLNALKKHYTHSLTLKQKTIDQLYTRYTQTLKTTLPPQYPTLRSLKITTINLQSRHMFLQHQLQNLKTQARCLQLQLKDKQATLSRRGDVEVARLRELLRVRDGELEAVMERVGRERGRVGVLEGKVGMLQREEEQLLNKQQQSYMDTNLPLQTNQNIKQICEYENKYIKLRNTLEYKLLELESKCQIQLIQQKQKSMRLETENKEIRAMIERLIKENKRILERYLLGKERLGEWQVQGRGRGRVKTVGCQYEDQDQEQCYRNRKYMYRMPRQSQPQEYNKKLSKSCLHRHEIQDNSYNIDNQDSVGVQNQNKYQNRPIRQLTQQNQYDTGRQNTKEQQNSLHPEQNNYKYNNTYIRIQNYLQKPNNQLQLPLSIQNNRRTALHRPSTTRTNLIQNQIFSYNQANEIILNSFDDVSSQLTKTKAISRVRGVRGTGQGTREGQGKRMAGARERERDRRKQKERELKIFYNIKEKFEEVKRLFGVGVEGPTIVDQNRYKRQKKGRVSNKDKGQDKSKDINPKVATPNRRKYKQEEINGQMMASSDVHEVNSSDIQAFKSSINLKDPSNTQKGTTYTSNINKINNQPQKQKYKIGENMSPFSKQSDNTISINYSPFKSEAVEEAGYGIVLNIKNNGDGKNSEYMRKYMTANNTERPKIGFEEDRIYERNESKERQKERQKYKGGVTDRKMLQRSNKGNFQRLQKRINQLKHKNMMLKSIF